MTGVKRSRLIVWLASLAVVLLVLAMARDLILKVAIEQVASQVLGAKIEMRRFTLGIFTHKIRIQDIKIHNPPGFPAEVFCEVPEVLIDIDLPAATRHQLHFPLVVFNLEKMVVYRNKEKKLNVDQLKIVQEQLQKKKQPDEPEPQMLPFKVDEMRLNIGQVIFIDASKPGPPVTQAYDIGLKNKTIKNIDGIPKLVSLVLVEALKPTAIRSAGLVAASALAGVGFLPVAAFGFIVAEDGASVDIPQPFARVHDECLKMVKALGGQFKREDKPTNRIFAKVYGCDVSFELTKKSGRQTRVLVRARKFLMAKSDIASGLLYQLKERLK